MTQKTQIEDARGPTHYSETSEFFKNQRIYLVFLI